MKSNKGSVYCQILRAGNIAKIILSNGKQFSGLDFVAGISVHFSKFGRSCYINILTQAPSELLKNNIVNNILCMF